jgi:alpha-L-rhamnosidase
MRDVLTNHGSASVADDVVNQSGFPGWGWMLDNGATTLWEHWSGSDNTFSNNHPMFGSVGQWFFNCLGGFRPSADAVGFDKILIAPQPVGNLQWVKATYQSVRGPVTCDWKKTSNLLEISVSVPVGATATVWVPAKSAANVSEGGKPTDAAEGVQFLRMDRGAAVFAVGAGSYAFASF